MPDIRPLYLNGQFVRTPDTLTVVNPATGEPIAQVSTANRQQVRQAIADAGAAFVGWREMTARMRGDFLLAIGAEMDRRKDETARLITLENGKTLAKTQGEEVMSIDHLR